VWQVTGKAMGRVEGKSPKGSAKWWVRTGERPFADLRKWSPITTIQRAARLAEVQ
jgi:hypothetical protein